nr:glycosyltransferase [uncultured Agathobaculum sp.]
MNGCTETDKPLISIVVPVYKAEQYLAQCVSSLIQQTYHHLEIILIDDGSPDRCGEICDSFRKKDSRVIVLHQENKGVSAARNQGIMVSQGQFIAFVDADDCIEPEYIMYLVGLTKQFQCDAAVIARSGYRMKIAEEKLTGEQALEQMLYQKAFDTAPWGKLFRKEIVMSNLFPEGMFYEDLAVICRMVAAAKHVAIGKRQLYHYRRTPDGTMQGGHVLRLLDEIKAADLMFQFVSREVPAVYRAANCRKFSACCQVFAKLPENGFEKEKRELWTYLKSSRHEILGDRRARVKNKIAAITLYFGENIFRTLWKMQQR